MIVSSKGAVMVGLQTLLQLDTSSSKIFNPPIHCSSTKINANFVVTKSFTATPLPRVLVKNYCTLCSSELSPNKDVYMYRGDQGFCSIKCRDGQIRIDDAKQFKDEYNYLSSNSYCFSCSTDRHSKESSLFEIASGSSSSGSSTDTRSVSCHVARPRGCRHLVNKQTSSNVPARRYNIPQYQRLLYHKHRR